MDFDYALLGRQLAALLQSERDPLARCASFVALLFDEMPDINWLGIYVNRGDELVLGPFQGRPACTRIPTGQGVCGTAARTGKTLRVDDVHAFSGHIACDAASNAELVVPLLAGDRVLGVLDIDSPLIARFSETDQGGVEALCRQLVAALAANGAAIGAFI